MEGNRLRRGRSTGGRLCKQRQVPQHERRLGQDAERVARLGEHPHDASGEVVFPLGLLVGIGVRSHRDVVALPPWRTQLAAEPFDGVQLHDDLVLEVLADTEPEIAVRWSRKTVRAGVTTSAIGVDRVLERHP